MDVLRFSSSRWTARGEQGEACTINGEQRSVSVLLQMAYSHSPKLHVAKTVRVRWCRRKWLLNDTEGCKMQSICDKIKFNWPQRTIISHTITPTTRQPSTKEGTDGRAFTPAVTVTREQSCLHYKLQSK